MAANRHDIDRFVKMAGVAAGVPLAAFAGFTAISHAVFHRSNMGSASEAYHWLKGTRRRMNEPITWDNYILASADANEARYSVPQSVDFHYKVMGFKVSIDEEEVAGRQVFVLNRREINDRAVIYLHGGSLLSQPTSNHWHFLDTVARRTRAEVIVPIYPLAPRHHWDETQALLESLYERTIDKYGADNVTLMGDEAGGGIAASFAEWLLAEGKPQPHQLILISPWVDLTLNNPLVPVYQVHDPLLSAYGMRKVGHLWGKGLDPNDWRLSPVNGRVRGLRNVTVFAGTREILYPDARLFFERVQATGANAEFVEGTGLNNNYPLYPLPEANKAIDKIVAAIAQD